RPSRTLRKTLAVARSTVSTILSGDFFFGRGRVLRNPDLSSGPYVPWSARHFNATLAKTINCAAIRGLIREISRSTVHTPGTGIRAAP
ncbi:MAG: hypothetical protein ACYDC5_05180, partial [Candidatus Dormibacteria bacterium]